MLKRLFGSLFALAFAVQLSAGVTAIGKSRNGYPLIIPQPKALVPAEGSFALPASLGVAAPEGFDLSPLARIYAERVKGGKVVTTADAKNALCRFELSESGVPESVEGYTLAVGSDGITVRARDVRGLFHGMQTLGWMIRNREADALKGCRISDWPDLEMRGIFFELPRVSPSKVDRLCDVIDALGALKYNMILIEFADNLPMENSPYTGRKETFGHSDVEKIMAAAKRNHIELVPKLQVASHTLWMTRHRDWAKLTEGEVRKPWCSLYCLSNPAVQPIVEELIRATADLIKPRYFHLGLDEITHCGYPICPKCKKANLTRLLLDHVLPVKKLLNDRGITPIIYQDEFFNLVQGPFPTPGKPMADFPEKLGRDVMINSWEYNENPSTTIGKKIRARGFRDLIYMSYSIRLGNSWKLPKIAHELNAKGNILAHWYSAPATLDTPDRSHFNSYPAIIAQANYSWNTGDIDFNRLPVDSAAVLRELVDGASESSFRGEAVPVPLAGVFNRKIGADPQFPRLDEKLASEIRRLAAADRAKFDVTVRNDGIMAAVLSGTQEDGYGTMPLTIPVGARFSGAAFLMAASIFNTFAVPDGKIKIGEIRIVYDEGKPAIVPLTLRYDLNDWNTFIGGNRSRAVLRGNDAEGSLFSLYSVEWSNPRPGSVIKRIDVFSDKSSGIATALFALSLAGADAAPVGVPAAVSEKSAPVRPEAALRPFIDLSRGFPAGTRKSTMATKGFRSRVVDDPRQGKMIEIEVDETTDQPARCCIDLRVEGLKEFRYLTFRLKVSDGDAIARPDIYWMVQKPDGTFRALAALNYAPALNSGMWHTVCLPRSRFNEKEHGGVEISEAKFMRISFFLRSPIKPLTIRVGGFAFADDPVCGRINLKMPAL